MQFIVILRGAPGSGKTTISKMIRSDEKRIAWLKIDAFKDFFEFETQGNLERVNELGITCIKHLITQGFSVMADGVFQNPECITAIKQLARDQNIPCIVFELQCSLELLLQRDKQREKETLGLRKAIPKETVERIFNTVKSHPYPGAIPLDTETLTVNQAVEIINSHLKI